MKLSEKLQIVRKGINSDIKLLKMYIEILNDKSENMNKNNLEEIEKMIIDISDRVKYIKFRCEQEEILSKIKEL